MSVALTAEAEVRYPRTTAGGGRDERFWAKRFIYRAERGDKSLLPVQILFAYQAMDLPVPKGDVK